MKKDVEIDKERKENKEKKEKINFRSQGKSNRARGARFERKVRQDLECRGWIVDKWSNNVDLSEGKAKLIPAKRKYNPFSRVMTIGTGFPDYIIFKPEGKEIVAVESKSIGYLDKVEKEKCKFLLQNKIFSKILIAKKGEKRGTIEYVEFNSLNLE